jgi:choline dehydrogenase-like flavoprotein
MANNIYDAIVVGSGISGGWAAKELSEKGLKTIMLERGMNIEHIKVHRSKKEEWDYPHRGDVPGNDKNYPVLNRDYPLNERNLSWWASDQDSPYTEVKRFDWFRGYVEAAPYCGADKHTASDLYLRKCKDGIAVDWPVDIRILNPGIPMLKR